MNVVFIICDTLVRDKIGPYHGGEGRYGHIRTPALDRFVEEATVFDNHWLNSTPCMPARRDFWSGRMEFPWRSWGPRESYDPDWARALRETDVNTCLVTDHANLFDVGAGNYHHWFDCYEFIRGHYNDHCGSGVPAEPKRPRHARTIYEEARRGWDDASGSFVSRTMDTAADWLDTHAETHRPFFLCIDEFDPHWPLDPPEPYRSMYLDDPALAEKGLDTFYKGSNVENYTDEELRWLNAQCAGKITLVDACLGRLFDAVDRNGLRDDTLVMLTTDHGEFIGEYGQMSKGGGFSYPLFSRIPLLARLPGSPRAGTHCEALTCAVDLHATVLDALGVAPDDRIHGRSLMPVLRGEADGTGREDVLFGWWGKGFYWTDGRRLLCKAPERPGPLFQYGTDFGEKFVGLAGDWFDRYADAETGPFLPHTDRPVYRVPMDGMAYNRRDADFDALFDLADDPWCERNLFQTDADLRADCLGRLVAAMDAIDVPAEQYVRLGLRDG